MLIKNNGMYLSVVVSLALLIGQTDASAACPDNTKRISVKGEIYNNAIAPGTTLGTAHIIYGKDNKRKCGVISIPGS